MTVISGTSVPPGTRGYEVSQLRLRQGELGKIVDRAARDPGRWRGLVRYDATRRWYHRMELTECYEVWLLSWYPGQGTGFHDHGGSRGAFAVARGDLQEQTVRGPGQVIRRTVSGGQVRSFGARFIHHVVNNSSAPAVSVHAYSPPLPPMRRYELAGGRLRCTGTEPTEPARWRPGPAGLPGVAR
jgi:Cysteine dioxygenase type I